MDGGVLDSAVSRTHVLVEPLVEFKLTFGAARGSRVAQNPVNWKEQHSMTSV
jgi:hypothetical protein